MLNEPETSPDINNDEQRDHCKGQKQPAPFLQDPSLILNAVPHYYLSTEGLTSLLEHLQATITGRGAIQVVIAEHGRGKSSLLRQLISEEGSRWLLCLIHADYHLGVDHIISGLGQTFFPDEEVDFESLVHGLVSYGHREPYPVVIIDDAQNLSSYAIETLANIKRAVVEQGGDIDIILSATPEMRKIVMSYCMAPFRDDWLEIHALPRFSEEETTTYLKTRYEKNGETLFTPSQLKIIHRRSCGIPACINYHAELALGRAVSDERLRLEHQQTQVRQKKQPYYLGAGFLAVILLAVLFSVLFRDEEEMKVDEAVVASPKPQVENRPADSDITTTALTDTAKTIEKKVKTPSPVAKNTAPKQITEKRVVVRKEVKAATVNKPTPKPKPVAQKPAPVATPVPEATVSNAKAAAKPLVAETSAPTQEVARAAEPKREVGKQAKPQVPTATEDGMIPGKGWLMAQTPENFTIQLAGSPSEKDIIRYINRSSLEGELAYVYLNRKNRSGWYVVLHGSFKSKQAALDIVDFFPPELRKNKPWIRQISTLQRSLGVD